MKTIYVFGIGALGSNLIIQLAKKYPDFTYTGIDFDIVSDRNIPIQAYYLEHVGMLKVQALAIVLQRYLRKVQYLSVNKKVTDFNIVADIVNSSKDYLVIDCFDNKESRTHIKAMGFKNCIHIGFSPQYAAEMIWDENYEVPNDVDPHADDICEVRDAIPFIGFVVNFSAMVISDFIDDSVKNNYIITNRFNIRKL